jgi:hypothetical protein
MARRYNDDAAYFSDLTGLAAEVPAVIARGPGSFSILAINGGVWVGECGLLRAPGDLDTHACHCRSFIA